MRGDTKYTDLELIRAIKKNGEIESAIAFVYENYYRMMEQYVIHNQGNRADAEDVIQEVLVIFVDLVRRDKYRRDSKVSTLLYSITRNVWLNEIRKRNKMLERDTKFENQQDPTGMDAGYYLGHRESQQEVSGLFNQLGESCRKLLRRFYFDNLPMKDILAEFNYQNEQVLRNKKYKCMQNLLQLLENSPALKQRIKSALQYE